MKNLVAAGLTLAILGAMFVVTVRSGPAGAELARAEGYTWPAERMLDIAMAQLGSTVPVRHSNDD
jgi:hypothetical protein